MKVNRKIKPVIYVGPSLSHDEARTILQIDADIRKPIARNDLRTIAPETEVVVIIDGVFGGKRAVSSFEILELLNSNISVFGASSMGALRAAELEPMGMIGVGEIFEMYRNGDINSDGDVALVFEPVTYRPISQPLINVRYSMKCACERGYITKEEKSNVIEIAKKIFFAELSYANIFTRLNGILEPKRIEVLKKYVYDNENELDLKRKDAIKMLEVINKLYR